MVRSVHLLCQAVVASRLLCSSGKFLFLLTLHPIGGVIRTGLGRGGASIEGVGLHLQGEIPLPRPCQKEAGSSPFANTPNESWWPMLRGVQWAAVTHTKGMPGWVEDWTTWDKVS